MSAQPTSFSTHDHPERVLVVNSGSSTLKLSLRSPGGTVFWQQQCNWPPQKPDLTSCLERWFSPLLNGAHPAPQLVVHRIVHGGLSFSRPTRLTPVVLDQLEALVPLAPLHNAAALLVINWLAPRLESGVSQWACFDTAFHVTLPEAASTYAIPVAWRQQGLRRYGFHGLNHEHVGLSVADQEPALRRLISCHLGAGCSLCAIELAADHKPRSRDTTMGFTPLEGLVMASRSGSVDPGVLLHQLRHGLSWQELDTALNHGSGLLALSEFSGDMRELRQAAQKGHPQAQLAIAVFRQQLLRGIGSMAASLGGVDGIALTGGIGQHDQALLSELKSELHWLEPLHWFQVPADEEGLMARQCLQARMQELQSC